MDHGTADLIGAPILHVSLAVTDLDAAAAFFETILGFRPVFGPVALEQDFVRLVGADCPDARLVQLQRFDGGPIVELIEPGGSLTPSNAIAHLALSVADLDAALSAARSAGAVSMGEATAFTEGRSAYVRTPGGAVIELEELLSA